MKWLYDYQLRRSFHKLIGKHPELTFRDCLAVYDFYGLIDHELANKLGKLLTDKGFD